MELPQEKANPRSVFARVASALNDAGNPGLARALISSVKELYVTMEQLRQAYVESDSALLSAQRELRESATRVKAVEERVNQLIGALEDIRKRASEAADPQWNDPEMLRRFLADIAASAREAVYSWAT